MTSPTGQPFGFQCQTCGVWHEGVPLDFGVELPDLGVPPDEFRNRVWTDGDFCTVDGSEFFVRGCLQIPVKSGSGPLVYGVWTSLCEQSFNRARELAAGADVLAGEPPWFGWFANSLGGYPETLLLKSLVHPRPGGLRPTIDLEPTDHPLAVEQREGITAQRLIEIVQRLLHSEG
jgi:hypothetical protein